MSPTNTASWVASMRTSDVCGRTLRTVAVPHIRRRSAACHRLAEDRHTLTGADVVVGAPIDQHGRSGFERLMLGSVAESVLRHASCPVLTVPPRAPDLVPMGPMVYRRILCGIDYSACSLKALEYAASLAHRSDAALIVVNVLEPILAYVAANVGDADNTTLRAAAERQLEREVSKRSGGHPGTTPLVVAGKAAPMILQLAEEQAVDVIVLGVANRSHLNMMWFGSTANRVVRQATCPVLTVRG